MQRILVIQNKRIGDVLIASVIAENIKKIFPESTIEYLVYDYTTGVIQNNPFIDRIIAINAKELKKPRNLLKLSGEIKSNNYDIIFDPYAKLQSKIICLFSKAKKRIGLVKPNKKLPFRFYTDVVTNTQEKSHIAGRSIEDRIQMIEQCFDSTSIEFDYTPKIHLTQQELQYSIPISNTKPIIMFGVLGSTPQKSLPFSYIAKLIDYIVANYVVNILFNYAPYQKKEALEIYELCQHKDAILIDFYEESIRGFITLMEKCDILISNEGGSVHIAKALDKPTFTIFSPYVSKEDWASFEDGIQHTSIHLKEERPKLYDSKISDKEIENDPQKMYHLLTPELIIPKLDTFLKKHC